MTISFGDIKDLLQWLRTNWGNGWSLVIALICVLVFGIFCPPLELYQIILVALLAALVLILWLLARRMPRAKRGQLGFIVSVHAEDEQHQKQVKADFIQTLHALVKSGRSGIPIRVIVLSNSEAQTVRDGDDAKRVLDDRRAVFMIWGNVRLRTLNGEEVHVLWLDAAWTHSRTYEATSNKLAKECASLLPRRLFIPRENDMLGFEATSAWANCVAKYTMGIARFISDDLDGAECLFRDVQVVVDSSNMNRRVRDKLASRLPQWFCNVYAARAFREYRKWQEDRKSASLKQMEEQLQKIPKEGITYDIALLKCIQLFVQHRDIPGALEVLRPFKDNKEHGGWAYSQAFLLAYHNDLSGAIRNYDKVLKLPIKKHVLPEVEEFLTWMLDEEPDKYQLYLCRGYINWKIKGDTQLACEDFEAFLRDCPDSAHAKMKRKVRKWFRELDR